MAGSAVCGPCVREDFSETLPSLQPLPPPPSLRGRGHLSEAFQKGPRVSSRLLNFYLCLKNEIKDSNQRMQIRRAAWVRVPRPSLPPMSSVNSPEGIGCHTHNPGCILREGGAVGRVCTWLRR